MDDLKGDFKDFKTEPLFVLARFDKSSDQVTYGAKVIGNLAANEVPFAVLCLLMSLAHEFQLQTGMERDYLYEKWKKELIPLLEGSDIDKKFISLPAKNHE